MHRRSCIFRYTCVWLLMQWHSGMPSYASGFQHHLKGFNFSLIPWYLWYLSPPAESENIIYISLSPLCQVTRLEWLLRQRYVSGKQHNQWKKRGFCFNSVITCCQIKLRFLGIMQNCLRNTKTISLMWVSVCVGMTSPNWLAAYHILFIFYHLAAFQCHATKT